MSTSSDSSKPEFWETRYKEGCTPWDLGGVPRDLAKFLKEKPAEGRVLIPGCGSAYEVSAFHEAGFQVTAIDFSEAAVGRAREKLGPLKELAVQGDFFKHDFGPEGFDLIYERAFLCSLPRELWAVYVDRVHTLLRPAGQLIGMFFFNEDPSGPPYGLRKGEQESLFAGRFSQVADRGASDSVAVFSGKERWQEWCKIG